MSTITELAQSLAAQSFAQLDTYDANAIARILELQLLEKGYADESEVTDDADKTNLVYRLAYFVTLSALDVVRSKLKRAQATPAEGEFRDMVKDFEALLKRLAAKAGIKESGDYKDAQFFLVDKVPYFPEIE